MGRCVLDRVGGSVRFPSFHGAVAAEAVAEGAAALARTIEALPQSDTEAEAVAGAALAGGGAAAAADLATEVRVAVVSAAEAEAAGAVVVAGEDAAAAADLAAEVRAAVVIGAEVAVGAAEAVAGVGEVGAVVGGALEGAAVAVTGVVGAGGGGVRGFGMMMLAMQLPLSVFVLSSTVGNVHSPACRLMRLLCDWMQLQSCGTYMC